MQRILKEKLRLIIRKVYLWFISFQIKNFFL